MTTRRKIYKLEMQTPTDESDLHPHLCQLLGTIDGVCFPVRFAGDQSRYTSEVLSGRDCMRDGVTYSVDTSEDTSQQASWKRSERVRSAMAAAGWITIANAKCKLTHAGDILARSLVGQASLNDLVPRIFELLKRATPDRPSGWISATTLFRIESTNSDDYQACSEAMLPLLAFGFVESASSTVARLFYRRLVDELPVKVDCAIGEYNADLSQAYTDAFIISIKQRCNRDTGSELCVPLSAS